LLFSETGFYYGMPELLDSLPSEPAIQNPALPGARIKKASDIVSDYQTLFDEDFMAAQDRARAQSMVDGDSPYSEEELRRNGIHGITNVNWGDLASAQREAEQPFNDILESMSSFGRVPFREGAVAPEQRARLERVIEEELYRLITKWDDFHFRWTLNAHYFTMWGVSFTYHDDHLDWRWNVGSMQDFKLPRGTKASINAVDRVACKVSMQPSDLYQKLQSAEIIGGGWNREQIIKSVNRAQPKPLNTSDPEALQAMYKDNAVFAGNTTVVVEVVHEWVKELDGSVSHYIADYNGKSEDNDGFLYERRSEFGSMSQFINAYLYGVGTNGDFHSIRGNAYALFGSAYALNKLRCAFIDKARDEATTFLTTENEDATIDTMLTPRGPYFQVNTGTTFVERTTPPAAHNLVPAISAMTDVFRMRTGGMAPNATSSMDRGQKTKYELQRRDEMDGKLSSDVLRRFFTAWGRDYREVVRRVSNADLTTDHPGGDEVMEYRRRCIERGVPEEALFQLDYDNISLNMGIGKGSTSERRAALGYLNEFAMPRLDPMGQRILLREGVAAYTDARFALELVPEEEGQRPPIDQQIANMENQLMKLGVPAVLEPNQDHVVHCGTHILMLQELNEQITVAAVELQDVIPQMQVAAEHATAHMEFIDPMTEPYPVFKEALQQLNEVITNGAKHIESERRKAEKAAAMGQPAPDTAGTPPGIEMQAADARARLETMQQESVFKLQAKEAETRQKLAINDAFAAQKIRHAELMNRVKMQTPTRTPKPAQ
jgi:hypothetical protein